MKALPFTVQKLSSRLKFSKNCFHIEGHSDHDLWPIYPKCYKHHQLDMINVFTKFKDHRPRRMLVIRVNASLHNFFNYELFLYRKLLWPWHLRNWLAQNCVGIIKFAMKYVHAKFADHWPKAYVSYMDKCYLAQKLKPTPGWL